MSIHIKNATVVSSRGINFEEIIIENEKIIDIGINLHASNASIFDASNTIILPGGIDAHTHMELPQMGTVSSDTFSSGTTAALMGGTTTIIDFANQQKGDSLSHTLNKSLLLAQNKSYCDYSFHLAVTDLTTSVLNEIPAMIKQHGITSFKSFLAYDNLMLTNAELELLMHTVHNNNGIVTVHAEIGAQIKQNIATQLSLGNTHPKYHRIAHSNTAEAEATLQAITLGAATQCATYIVHVSCKESLEHIIAAKQTGQKVFAETCPQYLFLDDSLYNNEFLQAAKFVMSPPLREIESQNALWKALSANYIDVVATDHCPFLLIQKQAGQHDFSKIPNGAPGVEDRINLLFSECMNNQRLSLMQLAQVTAINPAKIFGLYPQKGDILIGSDADLSIFNPHNTKIISAQTHHMNVDYSCFENFFLHGCCESVFLRGQLVMHNGKLQSATPTGKNQYRTFELL